MCIHGLSKTLKITRIYIYVRTVAIDLDVQYIYIRIVNLVGSGLWSKLKVLFLFILEHSSSIESKHIQSIEFHLHSASFDILTYLGTAFEVSIFMCIYLQEYEISQSLKFKQFIFSRKPYAYIYYIYEAVP